MKPEFIEHYRMLRGYGQTAASAINGTRYWMKREPLPDIQFEPYHHETATWEQDGFKIVAKLKPDYEAYGVLSQELGRYCNANVDGAIPRNPNKVDRNSYTHFLPVNPEYGKQDLKRMEDYNDGDWSVYDVIVKVYKQGIELASDRCGGVESDSDVDHFREVARDLAKEALSEAKKNLVSLCRS